MRTAAPRLRSGERRPSTRPAHRRPLPSRRGCCIQCRAHSTMLASFPAMPTWSSPWRTMSSPACPRPRQRASSPRASPTRASFLGSIRPSRAREARVHTRTQSRWPPARLRARALVCARERRRRTAPPPFAWSRSARPAPFARAARTARRRRRSRPQTQRQRRGSRRRAPPRRRRRRPDPLWWSQRAAERTRGRAAARALAPRTLRLLRPRPRQACATPKRGASSALARARARLCARRLCAGHCTGRRRAAARRDMGVTCARSPGIVAAAAARARARSWARRQSPRPRPRRRLHLRSSPR